MRPLTISVPTAGALLGLSTPSAYRRAKEGGLPLVLLGGRFKVSVAKLEAMIGEPLTVERIAAAQAKVTTAPVAVP